MAWHFKVVCVCGQCFDGHSSVMDAFNTNDELIQADWYMVFMVLAILREFTIFLNQINQFNYLY